MPPPVKLMSYFSCSLKETWRSTDRIWGLKMVYFGFPAVIFLDFKMTAFIFIFSPGKEGKKPSTAFPLSSILAVTIPIG